ncbi:MAG: alpha/beta hydrolase [Chitinophagaceae bacterium]|nr:MAG: alpha/beta hydrolase [Chitinophagaceae bacterium]
MKKAELNYVKKGKGPVMLLLHGFGFDGTVWDMMLPELSETFTLIIPDMPGFGNSDLPKDKPLTIDSIADKIDEIIEIEKVKEFTFTGHSMGGYVGLAYLDKFPQKLNYLALLNSHAFEDSADRVGNRKKTLEFIEKYGSRPFIKEFYKTIFHADFKLNFPEVYDSLLKKSSSIPAESLICSTKAMINRPDRTTVVRKSNVPLCLILGDQDKFMILEQCAKMAELADFTDFHILKNSGHMGLLEEPTKVSGILKKTLNFQKKIH